MSADFKDKVGTYLDEAGVEHMKVEHVKKDMSIMKDAVDKITGEVKEEGFGNEVVYGLLDSIGGACKAAHENIYGLFNLPLSGERGSELVKLLGRINAQM